MPNPQTIRPDASTTRTASPEHGQVPNIVGSGSTLAGTMDELAPVTADFIRVVEGSRGDVLVVGLGNPTNTPDNDYNHIIRVALSKNTADGANVGFICELRQNYIDERVFLRRAALNEALDDSETGVDVVDSALFASTDRIRIDSEWMLITSIGASTLTVTRAVLGSTAAAHATGNDIAIDNLGILVASFTCRGVTTTPTYYRYRLTTTEAALITDYTALSMRFVSTNTRDGALRQSLLHWCEVEVPDNTEPAANAHLTTVESARIRQGLAVNQESDRSITVGTAAEDA